MSDSHADSGQSKVLAYYEESNERSQLAVGAGLLEFARMQEIIG